MRYLSSKCSNVTIGGIENSTVKKITLIDQAGNETLEFYNWVLHCSHSIVVGIATMGLIYLLIFRVG